MRYQAEIVSDAELPAGIGVVVVERSTDVPLVLVTESRAASVIRWYEERSWTLVKPVERPEQAATG